MQKRAFGGSCSARIKSKPFSDMFPSLLPPLFAEECGDWASKSIAAFLLPTEVTCEDSLSFILAPHVSEDLLAPAGIGGSGNKNEMGS